jgi:hypothetical protein
MFDQLAFCILHNLHSPSSPFQRLNSSCSLLGTTSREGGRLLIVERGGGRLSNHPGFNCSAFYSDTIQAGQREPVDIFYILAITRLDD